MRSLPEDPEAPALTPKEFHAATKGIALFLF